MFYFFYLYIYENLLQELSNLKSNFIFIVLKLLPLDFLFWQQVAYKCKVLNKFRPSCLTLTILFLLKHKNTSPLFIFPLCPTMYATIYFVSPFYSPPPVQLSALSLLRKFRHAVLLSFILPTFVIFSRQIFLVMRL